MDLGPDALARYRRIRELARDIAGKLGREAAQTLGAELLDVTERPRPA